MLKGSLRQMKQVNGKTYKWAVLVQLCIILN